MARTPIYILLTTYQRTTQAVETVEHLKRHLIYDGEIRWVISDDGSDAKHVETLLDLLPDVYLYNAQRRGVGHGMNRCLQHIQDEEGKLVLMMEDDWSLDEPFDISPHADLLINHQEIGLIRYGYLSPGLNASVISLSNQLWWKVEPQGYQYRFTGHPSLRHLRFHEQYGFYAEGKTPGETELDMCGKVNAKPDGPWILLPCYYRQQWGMFSHIGSESLAGVQPE